MATVRSCSFCGSKDYTLIIKRFSGCGAKKICSYPIVIRSDDGSIIKTVLSTASSHSIRSMFAALALCVVAELKMGS